MAPKATEPLDPDIPSVVPARVTVQDRIAAFVMLDGMGNATLAQKTVRLAMVGFPPADIAAMLQTTTATVYQYLYEARKKRSEGKKVRPTSVSKL